MPLNNNNFDGTRASMIGKRSEDNLERRAQHCVNHHHACDCREWHQQQQLDKCDAEIAQLRAELVAKDKQLATWLNGFAAAHIEIERFTGLYESAVQGRREFRQMFMEAKQRLAEVEGRLREFIDIYNRTGISIELAKFADRTLAYFTPAPPKTPRHSKEKLDKIIQAVREHNSPVQATKPEGK